MAVVSGDGQQKGDRNVRSDRLPGDVSVSSGLALAKIRPPALADVYSRTRLFERLDQAATRPFVWISAPAGSGKTSLVASYLNARVLQGIWYQADAGDADVASFFYYLGLAIRQACPQEGEPLPLLTPEYQLGLPTFARNYFRRVFERMPQPGVVIVDNYQEIPAASAFHELFAAGLTEAPPGINIYVISRGDPPPSFARLRTTGDLTMLGWDDLRLTEQESAGIARLWLESKRGRSFSLPLAAIESLHRQAHGWVAGLVLMLEQARTLPEPPPEWAGDPSVIFDFFANEVFRHTDPSTQEFLARTAFLPTMTAEVAHALTRRVDAKRVLCELTHHNYFTIRHAGARASFEYHPLFRAFLQDQAVVRYSAAEIREIKRQSAELLADAGDIETAVDLLQQAQDWPRMMALALEHAGRWVTQGRHHMLANWLESFPDSLGSDNPWILYWLGICNLPFDPAKARPWFEKAFRVFEARNEITPLYMAWAGVVDSFVFEGNDLIDMDEWLDVFPTLRAGAEAPAPEVEVASVFSYFRGLFYRRPDHPDFPLYAARAESLFLDERDPKRRFAQGASLACCSLWMGDIPKAARLLDMIASRVTETELCPEDRIRCLKLRSFHVIQTGEPEEGIRLAERGLAMADEYGVHLLDELLLTQLIFGYMLMGNVMGARGLVARLAPSVGREHLYDALYHLLSSGISRADGDLARAIDEARRAIESARASGMLLAEVMALLLTASILMSQGEPGQALAQIGQARAIGRRISSPMSAYWCAFTEAAVHRHRQQQTQAVWALREALKFGYDSGMPNPPWYLHDEIPALCALAFDQGIHPEYVQTIVRRLRLSAPADVWSEQWPWPLKIYTLGRFQVMNKDVPLKFDGKAQRRPLDLLKAIIAHGGRDVPKEALSAALWPEAEGDAAQQAFTVTLHRLRRLLGSDDIVNLTEGVVTLDASRVWVDVWALDRSLAKAAVPGSDAHQQSDVLDRALNLYKGPFLAAETFGWAETLRERLHSKLLRMLMQLGHAWETRTDFVQAIHCYQKGIEVDPLAEELYRRLMHCYWRLDRRAEAIALYRRCRAILGSVLSLVPARETELLYEEIQGETHLPAPTAAWPRVARNKK